MGIYANENSNLIKGVRNIPGVDICNVHRLNLKQLAPGGHLGRFLIFTEDAFKALDQIFGTFNAPAGEKGGYHLHKTVISNPDISRIINSNEVQTAIRDKKQAKQSHQKKINPYTNKNVMDSINPHRNNVARVEKEANEANRKKRQEALKSKRGSYAGLSKDQKKNSNAYMSSVLKHLEDAYPQKAAALEEED